MGLLCTSLSLIGSAVGLYGSASVGEWRAGSSVPSAIASSWFRQAISWSRRCCLPISYIWEGPRLSKKSPQSAQFNTGNKCAQYFRKIAGQPWANLIFFTCSVLSPTLSLASLVNCYFGFKAFWRLNNTVLASSQLFPQDRQFNINLATFSFQ